MWPSFALGDLSLVDWSSLALHLPHIATVSVMALVGLLVRVTGLEEGVGVELDLDREFVSGGCGRGATRPWAAVCRDATPSASL